MQSPSAHLPGAGRHTLDGMPSSFRRHLLVTLTAAACTLIAVGCHRREIPEAEPALTAVIAGNGVPDEVIAFYKQRENAPAWVTHRSPSKRASTALEVLNGAPAHGLVDANYGGPDVAAELDALEHSKDDAPGRLEALAAFDVRMTTGLLRLGHDVAVGRTTPERLASSWKARRTSPDIGGTLNAAIDGDLSGWLAAISPRHPEYALLQKALAGLRETEAAKPGATATAFYNPRTTEGLKAFQEHHGIKATGKADKATLAALRVPIAERIRQVEVNLERWRWMPDDFGAAHLLVNIPLYQVLIRENNKTVQDIRVVVGKTDHETPIFSGNMTTVVFSPYWNIPDSIVQGETAPAMAKNPKYLASHHIEILRVTSSGTTTVPPASVNWDDPEELRHLAFRQLPGPDNALGHVKFLFPNEFSVYLHDSPADELFARPGRALSHGCVRVEEPEALAKYVLRNDPTWPMAKILTAMHSGVETTVKLAQPLPVHIVYFTAWVDGNGGLHFQPDVYGYDAKQMAWAR